MPPRPVQQRPVVPALPPQTQASSASQLNPAQLAQLQEYIRQQRLITGGEVTAAMVQDWMSANRAQLSAQGSQQPQQQQMDHNQQQMYNQQQGQAQAAQQRQLQAQQQAQQQQAQQQQAQQQQQQQQQQSQPHAQASLDQIVAHLFPAQLSQNQQAAAAHLTNILFPPSSTAAGMTQSPLLQQVMVLAQNGRLTPEQMAHLKNAVAMRHTTVNQAASHGANQNHQQQQQQLSTPPVPSYSPAQQQQMSQLAQHQAQLAHAQAQAQAQQQQQQQYNHQQGLHQAQPGQQPPNAQQSPNVVITQLQARISAIETLLNRTDITDEKRAQGQGELETARSNLQRVVKQYLSGANGQPGGVPMPSGSADLQQAQRMAMAQREAEIKQRANMLQQPGQYRTGSPAGFNPALPATANGMRPSPSVANQSLPSVGSPPNVGSPADSSQDKKNLAKKPKKPQQGNAAQQAAASAMASSQAQQQALANAQNPQALAQAQQLAQQQQQAAALAQVQALASNQNSGTGAASGSNQYSAAANAASGSQTPANSLYSQNSVSSALPIPQQLSVPHSGPESFPAPRPTLSSGLANSPVVSTPAITKHPGLDPAQVANALGPSRVERKEDIKKDTREDSKGRTVSKRKIRELVETVDPEERLDDDVEDLLLDIADEFVDSVTRFACQLAKHRKSDRLEVKDLALHLDRSYGIKVPGFAPEETRQSQSRRLNLPPGFTGRVAAVREASKRR